MQDNLTFDEKLDLIIDQEIKDTPLSQELRDLIISDNTINDSFKIYLFHELVKENKQTDDLGYFYDDYLSYKSYTKSDKGLNTTLTDIIQKNIDKTLVYDVINDFRELMINEGKQLIYTLSRLLYIQNKYKDDEIGQKIDAKIKEWINYINTYDENETSKIIEQHKKDTKEYIKAIDKLSANIFYYSFSTISNRIKKQTKDIPIIEFFSRLNYKDSEIKDFIKNSIINDINDSETYHNYNEKINDFINDLEVSKNLNIFEREHEQEIKDLKEKQEKGLLKRKPIKLLKGLNIDPLTLEINDLYVEYVNKNGFYFTIQDNDDIKIWRDKALNYINYLIENDLKEDEILIINFALNHLAFSDYQKKAYSINKRIDEIKDLRLQKDQEAKANIFYQSTSRQLKYIDNARGGLVTYTETDTQSIKNAIKEKQESLKNTFIKQDKQRLKDEIAQLEKELLIKQQKEKELNDEYKSVCKHLIDINKSMIGENKTSSYYKDLKKQKKATEQRKREIERVLKFSGWQLTTEGRGDYEIILNERNKEKLRLSIENLSKSVAKYTKEEQDIFSFLINKHLRNTDIKEIKFTLREYEDVKKRVRPTNYLMNDIQAVRLLLREIWTYYTTKDNTFTFTEEHLFKKLTIKGELENESNNLDNISLDTEISLEPTETLQRLLQDHDNYLYVSTTDEIMQLNIDNEYLAKCLIRYLNYLARVKQKSTFDISLDAIITELQHYGLKHYNTLDRHKTFKTEIVDVIDKTLSVLEGDNHLNKRFIEVLDREPFISYDNDYRGKNQETSINEWGKQKIKIKVFNLDDNKLLDTKTKHTRKKRTTKK